MNKLFHRGHFVEDEYSFINFNYDIVLDKALMPLLSKNIYLDYGINFKNEKEDYGVFPN